MQHISCKRLTPASRPAENAITHVLHQPSLQLYDNNVYAQKHSTTQVHDSRQQIWEAHHARSGSGRLIRRRGRGKACKGRSDSLGHSREVFAPLQEALLVNLVLAAATSEHACTGNLLQKPSGSASSTLSRACNSWKGLARVQDAEHVPRPPPPPPLLPREARFHACMGMTATATSQQRLRIPCKACLLPFAVSKIVAHLGLWFITDSNFLARLHRDYRL